MIDVRAILDLHEATVVRWHEREIDNPYEGFLHVVCLQHEQNFRLWHQEDIARSPDVTDAEMAGVKRAIDQLNQQRNDLIERLDDCPRGRTGGGGRATAADGPAEHGNTRQRDRPPFDSGLAALSHGGAGRPAGTPTRTTSPRPATGSKFFASSTAISPTSLGELLADIFAGRKRLQVYRQFKMYNDPTMNPYLYAAKKPAA